MASSVPTNIQNSRDLILQQEGTWVGASLGEYTGTPVLGNVLQSRTFISGGTFNVWIKRLYINCSVAIKVLVNVTNANGIAALDAVTINYIDLEPNKTFIYEFDRMLLYDQVLQFIFQDYNTGPPAAIEFRTNYDGYRIFMNRNMYAPKAIKFIGNSITAGADSVTSNSKPYASWASQWIHSYWRRQKRQNVKGINKAVGGITAGTMNSACITGWATCMPVSIVVFALGTNPDATPDDYETYMNQLIDEEMVENPNAWYIICNPPLKDSSNPVTGEPMMIQYRAKNVLLVNQRGGLASKFVLFEFDKSNGTSVLPGVTSGNVHPNTLGHDYMEITAEETSEEANITI